MGSQTVQKKHFIPCEFELDQSGGQVSTKTQHVLNIPLSQSLSIEICFADLHQ